MIELMISVAIIGIIASIAIPNFKRYKSRAQASERYSNLKSLYVGASSYYQTPHVTGASVTSSDATHCLPVSPKAAPFGGDGAAVANAVLAPPITVLMALGAELPAAFDWSSDPLWRALNFSMDAPSHAGYFAHTASSLAGSNCSVPADSGTDPVYQIGAFADFDDSGSAGWTTIWVGSRNDSLYKQELITQQEY